MSGLGHQLVRLASIYHIAKIYNIPRIRLSANPVCPNTNIHAIYDHLIGEGPVVVDSPVSTSGEVKFPPWFPSLQIVNPVNMSTEDLSSLKRDVHANGNMPIYRQPLHAMAVVTNNFTLSDLETEKMKEKSKEFYGKDSTDYELYQQLMLLFKDRHQSRIQRVLNATTFEDHTVFALHVRTGNGEKRDFQIKKRGIKNLDEWIQNLMNLFCDYSVQYASDFIKKPLMIYMGTDKALVVEKFQNVSLATCKLPVVSAEQEYPPEGGGVSYALKYGDTGKCLKAWEDMFLDMYLFTRCHSVIAGTYSSFTQSAPLSYVFEKAKMNVQSRGGHPHRFCQVGQNGSSMECFDNHSNWLLNEEIFFFGNVEDERQHQLVEIQFPDSSLRGSLRNLFDGTALQERNSIGEE